MNYHLESRGGVIYFVTEDGKAYRYEWVLNHRQRLRVLDELRDEYTRRRDWYRRHVVSRDMPNSKAARADFGDGSSWESKLIAWLDGQFAKTSLELPCIVAKRNCKRIAKRLMLNHWWRVGYFVAAVWQNGRAGRAKTMADFEISDATYYRRCQLYAALLGWGNGGEKRFSQRC